MLISWTKICHSEGVVPYLGSYSRELAGKTYQFIRDYSRNYIVLHLATEVSEALQQLSRMCGIPVLIG